MMYGIVTNNENAYILTCISDSVFVSSGLKELASFSKDSSRVYCYEKLSGIVANNHLASTEWFNGIFSNVMVIDELDAKTDNGIAIYLSQVALNKTQDFGVQYSRISLLENDTIKAERMFTIFHKKEKGVWGIEEVVLDGIMGRELIDIPYVGGPLEDSVGGVRFVYKDWETGGVLY